MPQSYKEYSSGELSTKTYNVPFKYISINDVNVIGFDGEKWTPLALDASSPTNDTNKTITLASIPASSYTKIRLYRVTSTAQLVDFQNGSRLSERDLDTAYQQGLFAAQEIAEDASTSQFTAVLSASLQAGTSLSNFASQTFTGDGATDVFSITAFTPQTSVQEAYRVSIDGAMQSPADAYEINLSPAKITFLGTDKPPAGSKIVVVTAASAASAVSVDDVTIGLTSTNKAQVKDGAITPAKLSTGAPYWNSNGGQLSLDGVDTNGDGNKAAGIEINSNLSSGLGYAYIDFHTQSGTNPNYDARIYNNTNGTFLIENKTNGRDIILQTTNSSGTTSNALQVDGEQNVRVRGDITGDNDTGRTAIYGGTFNNGANIELYSGSHNNGPNKAYYDASEHNFRPVNGSSSNGMKLDSNGKFMVGLTTSPTGVANSICCRGRIVAQGIYGQTTSNASNMYIDGSGFIFRSTSSARYKENIKDYSKGIEAIKTLRPVTFESINEDDDNTYAGFIAEEVHDAGLTEFVEYNPEGQPDALHYANMTAVLTKALQEAVTKIETLEARIESLENA